MPITTTPATPLTADQLPAFAEQLQALKAELLARVRQQRGGEVSRADAAAEVRAQSQDVWAQTDAERELSVTLEEPSSESMPLKLVAVAAIVAVPAPTAASVTLIVVDKPASVSAVPTPAMLSMPL